MLNPKNGIVAIGNSQMEYIRFGSGEKTLIMLPGLGDGLRTMKGTALPFALMYRIFAKDFTIYAFSRLNDLPEGYTTRDMARDQKQAMDLLGIAKAHVFGVSMGGMIAQYFAVDYPEKVNKLILAIGRIDVGKADDRHVHHAVILGQIILFTAGEKEGTRVKSSQRFYFTLALGEVDGDNLSELHFVSFYANFSLHFLVYFSVKFNTPHGV